MIRSTHGSATRLVSENEARPAARDRGTRLVSETPRRSRMKRKWSRANKPDGNGLLRVPDLQAASAQIEGHAGSRPLCVDAAEYAKERSNLAPAHTSGARESGEPAA